MSQLDDMDCTAFLQWALPRVDLRWPGYRKVRRQVCRRLKRRIRELQLEDFAAYQARLEADRLEWRVLDECCHITISRFYRDRGVFDALRSRVLPDIASRARLEQRSARIWSAGCASGEEPYTLKILWDLEVANSHSSPFVSILATDVDNGMLSRARKGCFEPTSLYELPQDIVDRAFDREGTLFCVKQKHRNGIEFAHQDLRSQAPIRQFDLILCRYVAFTYFAKPLQEATLDRLLSALLPRGYLVIGMHESLPSSAAALTQMAGAPQILQKRTAQND